MSKSLRSMSKAELVQTVTRRIKEKKGGLGYLASVDLLRKK